MRSSISKRISALAAIDADVTNIRGIGDEWLAVCEGLFPDEAGYGYDKQGNIVFIPSRLNVDATTGNLCAMLRIADDLNRFEDTYGIPDENYYLDSIISHLRKRADKGDIQAKVILYFRARNKALAGDNAPASEVTV